MTEQSINLFDRLRANQFITADEQTKIEQFMLSRQTKAEPPLALRILVGIGAFFASICFVSFLGLARLIDFKAPSRVMIVSLIFMAIALLLGRWARRHDQKLAGDFLLQSSFCAMGVGKFLFLAWAATIIPDYKQLAMACAGLVLTVLTYKIYALSIDRFASAFVTMFFFQLGIAHMGYPAWQDFILMDGYFMILAMITGAVFMNGRAWRGLVPVGYASALMMCGITFFLSIIKNRMPFSLDHPPEDGQPDLSGYLIGSGLISVMLVGCMIWLMIWAAGGWNRWNRGHRQHLVIGVIGAICLGVVAAHGVMLAICLMILSYARHERWLGVMAVLYLPIYLIAYYYNMDMSLFDKSLILMLSGGILLLGWGYITINKLDREPT